MVQNSVVLNHTQTFLPSRLPNLLLTSPKKTIFEVTVRSITIFFNFQTLKKQKQNKHEN
jgi:hypothetical protein